MKWIKVSLQVALLSFLFLLCFPKASYGADVPISVRPILPENQLNETDGFYNLRMNPNQKQTIALEVVNNGDQPVTIHTEIVPASTSSSGAVIYNSENIETIDSSNSYPLSTIATTQGDVTIPAKEKTTVDIEVSMPDEEISGVLLGGVRISLSGSTSEEKDEDGQGFSIENEYAYVIAIKLSQNDDVLDPDMKILKVYPGQIAGRNTVKVNLQNPTNVLVGGINYEAKVYKSGSKEVLHQASYKEYQFAPTSNFDLPISWENKPFQAGTYMLKLDAKSSSPEGSWSMEQEFTISEKEAKELNEKAVELDKDYTLYIIIGAIAGVLLLVLLIILIVVLRKRKKEKQRRKKQNARKGTKSGTAKRPNNQQRSSGNGNRKNSNQSSKGKGKRPTNSGSKRK